MAPTSKEALLQTTLEVRISAHTTMVPQTAETIHLVRSLSSHNVDIGVKVPANSVTLAASYTMARVLASRLRPVARLVALAAVSRLERLSRPVPFARLAL